jgi:hypothetical protein
VSKDGTFTFPRLPFSDYILYLQPRTEDVKIDGTHKTFVIPHAPLSLTWPIQIKEFSISGQVTNQVGQGIP